MSSPLCIASSPRLDSSPPPLPPDSVYTSCYCEENIYLLAQAFSQLSEADTTGGRGPWPWQIYVVFISNGGKTVALWSQKARDGVVLWDYHVVLVLLPRSSPDFAAEADGASPTPASGSQDPEGRPVNCAWVYDFDTTLPVPCPWIDYIAGTFPYALDRSLADRIDERFHSLFRVIPADVYLDHFASDRSHMIVPAPAPVLEPDVAAGDGSGGTHGRRIGEAPEAREEGPRYSSPPPPYPPLRGAKVREMGIVHNLLESFVAMGTSPPAPLAEEFVARQEDEAGSLGSEAVRYGQVMDVDGFVRWLAGSPKEA